LANFFSSRSATGRLNRLIAFLFGILGWFQGALPVTSVLLLE
jgi:hypothetical protein